MTDPFILTVNYKGQEMPLTAQLVLQGYSHRFKILVAGTDLYFEPDEEGFYRAIKMPGQPEGALHAIDRGLLEVIQQKLAGILA